jgi:succinate dehydrogenase/fumarate reductase flavoprotein subunit
MSSGATHAHSSMPYACIGRTARMLTCVGAISLNRGQGRCCQARRVLNWRSHYCRLLRPLSIRICCCLDSFKSLARWNGSWAVATAARQWLVRLGPLEVAPGSHTWLGGLKVDVDGKTPVDGLFAAGETAGGIHGGNRIGGSALSSSLVYGRRAGRRAARLVTEARVRLPTLSDEAIPKAEQAWLASLLRRNDGPLQSEVRTSCLMLAHRKLGPIRDDETLREALSEYERIEREDVPAMRLDEKARTRDRRASPDREPRRALPPGLPRDRRRTLASGHAP